ncbi:hypothetical protein INR49_010361 [Caranx melampygus]|nr:hypothetical protein INR49_010361 [Caranx melampygus]
MEPNLLVSDNGELHGLRPASTGGGARWSPPTFTKEASAFQTQAQGQTGEEGRGGGEGRVRAAERPRADDRDDEDEDEEEKQAGGGAGDSARTLVTVPDSLSAHSKMNIHSNTLSPGSTGTGVPQSQPGLERVFCLPGEEDTVSAIVDVSSIPSQTTTTTPVNTAPAPALGSTTPGGGRVCRVREKVQGVLEKPWILRQKKERKGRAEKEDTGDAGVKGGSEGTGRAARTPSEKERKGVVHIREVDGKLCVVRTMYPSDYGSPLWRGQSDGEEVEVHTEPPAPSPLTGNILKVLLSEQDRGRVRAAAGDVAAAALSFYVETPLGVRGFRLESPSRGQERSSLLESGYVSDLPLTSPETAGTTPSQTDWGGLTSSSSERLDSMVESPLSLQQPAAVKYLPQISEIYVSGESGDLTAKEKLLLWSQQATEGYPGLRCTNFTSSWSDGRMFNALLHRYR